MYVIQSLEGESRDLLSALCLLVNPIVWLSQQRDTSMLGARTIMVSWDLVMKNLFLRQHSSLLYAPTRSRSVVADTLIVLLFQNRIKYSHGVPMTVDSLVYQL